MINGSRPAALSALEAVEYLDDAIARLRGFAPGAFITLPAPLHEVPEILLEQAMGAPAVFWDDGMGHRWCGWGEARLFPVASEGLAELSDQIESLLAGFVVTHHQRVAPVRPIVLGGLAFDPHTAVTPRWEGFDRGWMLLPRWIYRIDGPSASLSLTLTHEAEFGSARCWIAELEQALVALGRPWEENSPAPRLIERQTESRESWCSLVAQTRELIASGRVEKLVLARNTALQCDSRIDATASLQRMTRRQRVAPGVRFAFRRRERVFLGLTPELLVERQHLDIRSEALAGTMAIDQFDRAACRRELSESAKDRREHRVVVDELKRRLAPLCSSLHAPAEPLHRELADLVHLLTPIDGTLIEPISALRLVEALAPTPSVGGHPSGEALRLLERLESVPRGWYAGPIGWFDAAGNGGFWVGLRGALLDDRRIDLYTGAGIVADSDPASEWEEVEAKERSLLAALGVGGWTHRI